MWYEINTIFVLKEKKIFGPTWVMVNQSVAFDGIHFKDFVYNVLKYKYLIWIYFYDVYYAGNTYLCWQDTGYGVVFHYIWTNRSS